MQIVTLGCIKHIYAYKIYVFRTKICCIYSSYMNSFNKIYLHFSLIIVFIIIILYTIKCVYFEYLHVIFYAII